MKATKDFAGKLCTVCQTKIITGEEVVKCFACELPFHHECWNENKGCSAYGCVGAPKHEKTEVVNQNISWKTEKKCPSCSKIIKANALKCRFCLTSFNTNEEISAKEFSEREYEETEFLQVRNKIVILFLISMSGLLSIFGLIFTTILIFGGSFWGIQFKRLPPVLKIFAFICFGLNVFLILILFLLLLFDN